LERTPLSPSPPSNPVTRGLAEVFVSGPWREDDLVARGARAVGRRRWLRPLVRRVLAAFDGPRPTAARLAAFLGDDPGLRHAHSRRPIGLEQGSTLPPVMWPAPGGPSAWRVPELTTPAALAGFLGLELSALDWFADVQGRGRRRSDGPLSHYRYAWRPKATGPARLIAAPKPRLKAIQRRVLDALLAAIPPHEAAHGFRPGRSIRTFAAPHAGRAVVLRLDLLDFFPTVTAARVVSVLLTAGYPEAVARSVAGLCTGRVPGRVWDLPGAPASGPDGWRARRLYLQPHLPQGAPTSPALANLCTYRLDVRLFALASAAGATYTRYADDLAFSGGDDFGRSAPRFALHTCAAALEEGFAVNTRKTRLMRRGVRQHVAGVVVNAHPNVARDEYDRLKATIHNCVRLGPSGQNLSGHPDFRAHLAGRVAHVAMLNPARGRKLQEALARVEW
jgi:hypothetical protein